MLNLIQRKGMYRSQTLDFWVLGVEVLLKFRQLIQIPLLLAETVAQIPNLHGWGAKTATPNWSRTRPMRLHI